MISYYVHIRHTLLLENLFNILLFLLPRVVSMLLSSFGTPERDKIKSIIFKRILIGSEMQQHFYCTPSHVAE